MATAPKPGPFDERFSYRSLALVVENRQFYVPRDTLASFSPVFEAMFYGDFAEGRQDQIQLPGKKAKEIEELLRCLIPTPIIKAIDNANVDLMLEFAEEYQIKDLQSRCETFLIAKLAKCDKSDDQLLVILRIASKHRMRQLLEPAVKRCAAEFSFSDLQSVFDGLRSEVVACLMIFKNSVQSGTTCQFEFLTDHQYTSRKGHTNRRDCAYSGNHDGSKCVARCVFCENKHCFVCRGSNLKNVTCTRSKEGPDSPAAEDSVRALLDRIRV